MRQYRGMTKEGKWVYGWYIIDTLGVSNIYDNGYFIEVIPETVGQSIGWTALKGGKEIYKDDIIEFGVKVGFGTDKRFTGKVYFDSSRLAYCVDARPAWNMPIAQNLSLIDIEVIGTIHDKE